VRFAIRTLPPALPPLRPMARMTSVIKCLSIGELKGHGLSIRIITQLDRSSYLQARALSLIIEKSPRVTRET
jgi:hypothetical protein